MHIDSIILDTKNTLSMIELQGFYLSLYHYVYLPQMNFTLVWYHLHYETENLTCATQFSDNKQELLHAYKHSYTIRYFS